MDYIIRKATYADLDSLMKVFENARAIMRASGNLNQWNDGYPSETIVRNDITNGNCYVFAPGARLRTGTIYFKCSSIMLVLTSPTNDSHSL